MMTMDIVSGNLFTITFSPLLPWQALLALGIFLFALAGFGLLRRAHGSLLRTLAFGVLVLTLSGPRYQHEQRIAQDDIALVMVDRSPSQRAEDRMGQVDAALSTIRTSLDKEAHLDVRIVETSGAPDDGGTPLVGALVLAAADIPENRFAGAILLTDGQVHDAENTSLLESLPDGPVHTLVSGKKLSVDRRLVIEKVPTYGLVGQETDISFRVDQTEGPGTSIRPVAVTLTIDGRMAGVVDVRPGQSTSFQFKLDHADATIIELTAAAADGELSLINNTGVATINGVRDRLRVLLISGQPHAGERMWRNLFKSDPAVDLVHFTILRPPEKSDFTPTRELALISFPTFELFDLRIKEFDLIVFDRYIVRSVLTPRYFHNIGDYVDGGGAVLLALGPEFAGTGSLYETPLGKYLPLRSTGNILAESFQPHLTDMGLRHPVTSGLVGANDTPDGAPQWGRWFRQIDTVNRGGTVLMDGIARNPLLILDRVGKGRIGVLTSDQIWLWARGYDGGGPQAELVRRLAHWLMKEPALEEERLSAVVTDGGLEVNRRSLVQLPSQASILTPAGQTTSLSLEQIAPGQATGRFATPEPGVYRITDGVLTTLSAVGSLNPVEYADLRATDQRLSPLSAQSGGGVFWLSDTMPEIRRVKPGRTAVGADWIGFRANQSYVVSGIAEVALIPGWLGAALILGLLFAAWRREGKF